MLSEAQEHADERPRHLTADMKLAVAKKLAQELTEGGYIDPSEQIARDIARQARGLYTDGYSIAKSLDDSEGWDCNLEMAEILDGFSSLARDEIERAEKEWAQRTNPQPPFPAGTRVRLNNSRNETGVLDGIYEYGTAKYLVKIDGDPKADTKERSRRIVNFEDVSALPPQMRSGDHDA